MCIYIYTYTSYRYGALIFHSWIFDDFGAYFSKRKHTEDIKWTAEPLTPSTLDLPGGPGYIRYFSWQLSPITPNQTSITNDHHFSQQIPTKPQVSPIKLCWNVESQNGKIYRFLCDQDRLSQAVDMEKKAGMDQSSHGFGTWYLVPENGGFTLNLWQFFHGGNDDKPWDLGWVFPWFSPGFWVIWRLKLRIVHLGVLSPAATVGLLICVLWLLTRLELVRGACSMGNLQTTLSSTAIKCLQTKRHSIAMSNPPSLPHFKQSMSLDMWQNHRAHASFRMIQSNPSAARTWRSTTVEGSVHNDQLTRGQLTRATTYTHHHLVPLQRAGKSWAWPMEEPAEDFHHRLPTPWSPQFADHCHTEKCNKSDQMTIHLHPIYYILT